MKYDIQFFALFALTILVLPSYGMFGRRISRINTNASIRMPSSAMRMPASRELSHRLLGTTTYLGNAGPAGRVIGRNPWIVQNSPYSISRYHEPLVYGLLPTLDLLYRQVIQDSQALIQNGASKEEALAYATKECDKIKNEFLSNSAYHSEGFLDLVKETVLRTIAPQQNWLWKNIGTFWSQGKEQELQ